MSNSINDAELAKHTYQIKVDVKASKIADTTQKIRGNSNYIKALPGYTAGIGSALRIIGASNAPIDTTNYKPTISVSLGHGFVTIKFTKKGVEGVNVPARQKGETNWTFMALDTHSPYTDHRMLADATKPENREYMVVGVLADAEIGVPSDIASITFAG